MKGVKLPDKLLLICLLRAFKYAVFLKLIFMICHGVMFTIMKDPSFFKIRSRIRNFIYVKECKHKK